MQRALTVGVRSVKAGLKCCHDPSAASRKRRDSPVGMTAVAVTRRGCAREWEKNSHTPVRRVTHPTCSGRDDKWWRVGEGVSGVDGVGVLPAGSRRYRSVWVEITGLKDGAWLGAFLFFGGGFLCCGGGPQRLKPLVKLVGLARLKSALTLTS